MPEGLAFFVEYFALVLDDDEEVFFGCVLLFLEADVVLGVLLYLGLLVV